jgi:UDP-N-acetylglucosamine 2-epimerase (non-hydrolysing)
LRQKILSILGTRPEAVKIAPIIKALEQSPDDFESVVCITGQHRDMVIPILDIFDIQPDYDLDVMSHGQSLSRLTSRLLLSVDKVIEEVQPDWILAQGDTTTVMVASLLAYYHQRRFGHIEAGLRTGDKYRPFPEEGNRIIADVLADACFTPTEFAKQNLLKEGILEARIIVTGNTVVDALLDISSRQLDTTIMQQFPSDKRLILVTAHRRESFGEPFQELCYALRDIATQFDDIHLIYPVHLNPNVQQPVYDILSEVSNISLIAPLDYPDLLQVMRHATLVLTDSGGIQEEAPTFKVPLLVMRDKTERPEGIEAGVAKLVGTARENIVSETSLLLSNPEQILAMQGENPYGDGKAAARIVDYLRKTQAND